MKDEPSHCDSRARAKLQDRMKFPDNPTTREALEQLKEALATAPIRIYADFDREFILYINAC